MTLRYDDASKTLSLSVRDLVEAGPARGHLSPRMVGGTARMALGRQVHETWQTDRAEQDSAYRAEVRLTHQLVVEGWTVKLHGRVDGLTEEGGFTIVEELKSTAMLAAQLYATELDDWADYALQLELYLYMLRAGGKADVRGRLVLISVVDGSRHVLALSLDADAVEALVLDRVTELVKARNRRLAWLERRRAATVPMPFAGWRTGQDEVVDRLLEALPAREPVLVEAPTGMGKTAAVLYPVLRYALKNDLQVYWATSRTTQQGVVAATLERFVAEGLELSAVAFTSRENACLQELVDCRPEVCGFAESYYDKRRATDAVQKGVALEPGRAEAVAALAKSCELCPHALARDLAEHVDVVVGDYNYVFDPDVRSARLFAEGADKWIVVVDEAHQLVERARGYRSPRVSARMAREAAEALDERPDYAAFARLARDTEDAICDAAGAAFGRARDGMAIADLSKRHWRDLAERFDELGLDYALLRAAERRPDDREDAFLDLARAVARFVSVLVDSGEETVQLVAQRPGHEQVALLCLDPSPFLGPRIEGLGGFVGASATLSPPRFYRDLLGLNPDHMHHLRIEGVFPPENRKVLVGTRVSTAYRDRRRDAQPTADLLQECIRAVPGNVAVFFPSFAMLDDLASRWTLAERDVLMQGKAMAPSLRAEWLARLGEGGRPVVLAAVLGGIFGEGIDLPAGALDAVFVAGPAFPPVGLERDLLREYYESRYEQGFLYASLVPGMTRVIQAAGRLIRRPEDRGVVLLVGRRFRWRDVAALLPEDWMPEVADDPGAAVRDFFGTEPA
ncbi:MAG: PD-(D/E)XK nuclease family protein [Proteobacteria bacterium]|nr:PD-(D/E)XK nuclease family protein [Pseudomonadota bacterium]